MTRKGEEFSGLSVAIVTPFLDGEIDRARLRTQVEFQIAAGTTCLCPVGTTGESPTLTHAENEQVIAEVVQAADGRIKVMAGTGSNSTAEALRLTKRAAADGAHHAAPPARLAGLARARRARGADGASRARHGALAVVARAVALPGAARVRRARAREERRRRRGRWCRRRFG